jgi:hypothetical protein
MFVCAPSCLLWLKPCAVSNLGVRSAQYHHDKKKRRPDCRRRSGKITLGSASMSSVGRASTRAAVVAGTPRGSGAGVIASKGARAMRRRRRIASATRRPAIRRGTVSAATVRWPAVSPAAVRSAVRRSGVSAATTIRSAVRWSTVSAVPAAAIGTGRVASPVLGGRIVAWRRRDLSCGTRSAARRPTSEVRG